MMPVRATFSRSVIRHARRVALVAMIAMTGNAVMAADPPIRKIDVAFEGDAYIVNAIFITAAPPNIAWDVLTDFDRLAGWVPNVTESKVINREGGVVTVEQRGKLSGLGLPYVTQRRIELNPPSAIKTAQIKGNMRRVESTIMLEAEGKGTRIVYHLEMVPSFAAAAVMSKKVVESEVTDQFTAITGEMARRVQ
jgi:carbon monoxide dehydrogenase subunit G